ncbi:MAG: FmdE family protein [Nitrospirota bacterium]|jgi:formylmethanofuran dehydrogenase subunit E
MQSLEDVAAFHGHVCPGLALGYRVSELALREMGERAEDEELVAEVENDSCAVDAVQVLTGCTFGKGNLLYRDYGKQVYTFIKRPSGEFLRVAVKWEPPPETSEEKEAWGRYMKGDRSAAVREAVQDRKSRKIEAIMEAPEGELFEVQRGRMEPPHQARIYASLRCERCGEKVMEPRARLREGKVLCLPCAEAEDREG